MEFKLQTRSFLETMIWVIVFFLCAMVEEAAFYDDPGEDYEDSYEEEDISTSPMSVFREYSRRKRGNIIILTNHRGTSTKRSEYEDTESVLTSPMPNHPLTMLPVSPEHENKIQEVNPDETYQELTQIQPTTDSDKADNVINNYPTLTKAFTNINTGTIPMKLPTRSQKRITDSTVYLHFWRPGAPTRLPKSKTALTISPNKPETSDEENNYFTQILDPSTRSTNPNTDVSTFVQYLIQSNDWFDNQTDLSTNTISSPSIDTTTHTISSMSTLYTTDVFTSKVLTSIVFFPRTPFTTATICDDCEMDTTDALRTKKPKITKTPTTELLEYKKIDVPKLIKLLESVMSDDGTQLDLTKKFNETLQKYNIPTCADAAPTTPTTEPPSTINFNDAQVIAKCFVCGLDVERVPYSSACADAFAGDFIPLVPVDTKARGQIASFRKYCRYLDVNRVITTEEEPHSVFGRFTGGCSVRWVDLTSIYTQRACRNRRRAVLGRHFASKRMAKLEMALSDLDNGCIISPMATLLPVSRGISLYARFHACVCTGSWCNKAISTKNWITNNVAMLIVISYANKF